MGCRSNFELRDRGGVTDKEGDASGPDGEASVEKGNVTASAARGNHAGFSVALAFTYNANLEPGRCQDESKQGFRRDTKRLIELWGDESAGIAVSVVDAYVVTSPRFLRSDFSAKGFLKALEEHVSKFQLVPCIREIFLDYMWMPGRWADEKYGKNSYGLLGNIVELANRSSPSLHIKEGGVVFLPTPWQFYEGIVASEYWGDLKRVYRVEYIKYEDAESCPLVTSDMRIKEEIARLGKSVEASLDLLKKEGEQIQSLETVEDLAYWSGKDDIFMRLTRKTHGR